MSVGDHGRALSAVSELITTEESYTDSLHLLIDIFYKPLRDSQFKLQPLLTEGDIDAIFGNVEDLLVINMQLLDDLHQRVRESSNSDEVPRVGDIMKRTAPLLKLYEKYVRGYERAVMRLAECQRSSKTGFDTWLERQHQAATALGGQALESYLIMPVQRILRYKLLLEEIIRHTSLSSVDLADLTTALELVAERAVQCNEATRGQENTASLRRIQSEFNDKVEIVGPKRVLLREGELRRVMGNDEKARPYKFFLFNDALIYAKEDMMSGARGRSSYTLHRKFDIGDREEDSRVPGEASNRIVVPSSSEGGRMINVVSRGGDADECSFDILTSTKSFTVNASSPLERRAWVAAMEGALAARAGQRSYSAVAVPRGTGDAKEKNCQICNAPFSFLYSKRACRKCGTSTCSKCAIEMDRNGTGLQIVKKTSMKVETMQVRLLLLDLLNGGRAEL